LVGLTSLGPYAASKAALSIFAESLREEVADFVIIVAAIEPGPFRSNFFKNMKGPTNPMSQYGGTALLQIQSSVIESDQTHMGDVKSGANIIVDIISHAGTGGSKIIPARIPVGNDAYRFTTAVCQTRENARGMEGLCELAVVLLHALRAKPPTYLSQMSLYRLLCACSQI
jgi:hypothetical protein